MSALDIFQQNLGYQFKDVALLEHALRHASLDVEEDNEKLEFLGDRVLGLVIADRLVSQYGDEAEGALARRLGQLVSRSSCAIIADNIGLDDVLRTDAGIRKKDKLSLNVLANACEALLAAVYLDGGLEAARQIIERHWQSLFSEQVEAPIDSKSALQEWLLKRGMSVPRYDVVERSGPDHEPEFNVVAACDLGTAQGQGLSRKIAEQRAAATLLELLLEGEGA
jgi:ribonuclease-3